MQPPASHRLPNGLNVWLEAGMQTRDGAAGTVFHRGRSEPPVAESPTARTDPAPAADAAWHDLELHLIEATLQACEGNVSKAARKLGVSRGPIYRHLGRGTHG